MEQTGRGYCLGYRYRAGILHEMRILSGSYPVALPYGVRADAILFNDSLLAWGG